MALITLAEACSRIGISQTNLNEWIARGLLTVKQDCVDDDELADVAESIGWLQVSAEHWDGDEEE